MSLLTRSFAAVALLAAAAAPAGAGQLYAVDWDTGNLYQVSATNAALTLVGGTGLSVPADIQFAPDGTLYAITPTGPGSPAALYKLNPNTAAATLVGQLGQVLTEGALTITPSGTAYAFNGANTANVDQLLSINLQTGAATVVGQLNGQHDIDGMAFRSDGELVALDEVSDSLLLINPTTLAVSTLAAVPGPAGAVGGMTTIDGKTGFYATGILEGGTNSLFSVNLSTGASTLIGSFAPTITSGEGISGLAEAANVATAAPEPASLVLLGLGAAALALPRLRRRSG
jgi:hypothetical protein